jgi:hypothetical protein
MWISRGRGLALIGLLGLLWLLPRERSAAPTAEIPRARAPAEEDGVESLWVLLQPDPRRVDLLSYRGRSRTAPGSFADGALRSAPQAVTHAVCWLEPGELGRWLAGVEPWTALAALSLEHDCLEQQRTDEYRAAREPWLQQRGYTWKQSLPMGVWEELERSMPVLPSDTRLGELAEELASAWPEHEAGALARLYALSLQDTDRAQVQREAMALVHQTDDERALARALGHIGQAGSELQAHDLDRLFELPGDGWWGVAALEAAMSAGDRERALQWWPRVRAWADRQPRELGPSAEGAAAWMIAQGWLEAGSWQEALETALVSCHDGQTRPTTRTVSAQWHGRWTLSGHPEDEALWACASEMALAQTPPDGQRAKVFLVWPQ